MTRYRFGLVFQNAATAAVLALSVIVGGACSLSTSPDNKPQSAKIAIDGTTPNPLKLILSKDFFEQLNTDTGEYTPVLLVSDTMELALPYDRTIDITTGGSIYVEVYQPEVETATVHMKVDLDNGEGYEQNATLSDKAKLIYYFIFSDFSPR